MDDELIAEVREQSSASRPLARGRARRQHEPLHIPDLRQVPPTPLSTIHRRAGFRALLAVPLERPGQVIGLLIVPPRAGMAAQGNGRSG
jgi:GAF domain-containing protein